VELQEPGKLQYDGESWTHSGKINVKIGDSKIRVLVR